MSTQLCDFNMSTQFSVQEWGLQKNVMSLDFAEIENMSNGMTYRTH